jgi:hypothetical protein
MGCILGLFKGIVGLVLGILAFAGVVIAVVVGGVGCLLPALIVLAVLAAPVLIILALVGVL